MPVVVKECRHGRMMFDASDALIGRSLEMYGEWCEGELEVLAQVIEPGSVVLDVGANIGTHTVFFARAVGQKGEVLAFEPQRSAFYMLCGNVALGEHANVTCVNAGLGAQRGVAWVGARDANSGAVALSYTGGVGEQVDVLRVDDLKLPRCTLIKIDVEGMEADVIEGARETIARCGPVLFVENNTQEGSRAILEALDSVGYRGYWHIAPYFNPKNFRSNSADVFQQYRPEANMFCVPADVPVSGLLPSLGLGDDYLSALMRGSSNRRSA